MSVHLSTGSSITRTNSFLRKSSSSSIKSTYPVPESDLSASSGEPVQLKRARVSCSWSRCWCIIWHLIGSAINGLLSFFPSNSSDEVSDSKAKWTVVRTKRPDWYKKYYASFLDASMKSYEKEMAGYKSELFNYLRGKAQTVLEIGIGTGPNLKYYASDSDIQVYGVDPNINMETYARTAAISAGLPEKNFKFIQAIGESIPMSDASVDAVIGTIVLCSVEDVSVALKEVKRVLKPGGVYLFVEHVAAKDGTTLRFLQGALNPLQQWLFDGCHLTRDTVKFIYEAGFSDVDLNMVSVSSIPHIRPHVFGIATK